MRNTANAETDTVADSPHIEYAAGTLVDRGAETPAELIALIRGKGLNLGERIVDRIDHAIGQTTDDDDLGSLYIARALALQGQGNAAAPAAAARNAVPHLVAAGSMQSAAFASAMAAVFLDQIDEPVTAVDHAVDALVMLGDLGMDAAEEHLDLEGVRAALALAGFFIRLSAFDLAARAAQRAFQSGRLIDGSPIDAIAYTAGYVAVESAHITDDSATRSRYVELALANVEWLETHGIDEVSRSMSATGLRAEARHAMGISSGDLVLDGATEHYGVAPPDLVAWHQLVRGASALLDGDPDTAITRFDEAIPGLEASADNHCLVRALRGRARARADVGDFEGAYADAADLAERTRGWQIGQVGRLSFQLARRADMERSATELRLTAARLTAAIDSDATTGVNSRRWLEKRLDELADADADGSGAALMCDIDHFKHVNDTYGHHVGDDVLREFGSLLHDVVGDADIARFGGEEFVIILDDADATSGPAMAERLRVAVESHDWNHIAPGLHLTISCGVAYGNLKHIRSLLVVADSALLDAKHHGRNVVMTPAGSVGH